MYSKCIEYVSEVRHSIMYSRSGGYVGEVGHSRIFNYFGEVGHSYVLQVIM